MVLWRYPLVVEGNDEVPEACSEVNVPQKIEKELKDLKDSLFVVSKIKFHKDLVNFCDTPQLCKPCNLSYIAT